MQKSIDFNCDLGEVGNDDETLLALISSANIACGFHAGDPLRMMRAVEGCVRHNVAIGAHPSYFDRSGFGRRPQALGADEVHALVLYQIGALAGVARAAGARLHHVKPHGALYNRAADDGDTAAAVVHAVRDFDPGLLIYGLAGSKLTRTAAAAGLAVAHEAFAERRYERDGRLADRTLAGAIIETADDAIAQVRDLLRNGRITSRTGEPVAVRADTLCLHGDRRDAVEFADALRQALLAEGLEIRAPARS